MKNRPHTHPCSQKGCKEKVECHGVLLRNHDGFPEVVCDEYHLPHGSIADVRCQQHWDDAYTRATWAELEGD